MSKKKRKIYGIGFNSGGKYKSKVGSKHQVLVDRLGEEFLKE